ncbi:YaaL family protein [Brevibacillus fulvus]|uniref:DUF2508 domain-containing protein n=1 Tax=Brevibacillus fulvus TaxID=1125967 RepID=A0A938Y4C9_9BACL|nr:YaaL family protein [Brevibacillus fulvus]MBM7592079.1 hypothetical protein [Brevibacillus fulvus]
MLDWFRKEKLKSSCKWDDDSLLDAVEEAQRIWQQAQRAFELADEHEQIDEWIYQLQLKEKRYTFLLQQVKMQYLAQGRGSGEWVRNG